MLTVQDEQEAMDMLLKLRSNPEDLTTNDCEFVDSMIELLEDGLYLTEKQFNKITFHYNNLPEE